MRRTASLKITVFFITLFLPFDLPAHGGGLDSLGCHHDRKRGGYHCHRGPLAGRYFASKAEALEKLCGDASQRNPRRPRANGAPSSE